MQPPQIPLNYASPIAPPNVVPPSAGHLEQIAFARRLYKPVRRAAAVARFSAWTIAIFAGLTLFGGIVTGFSIVALLLGAGMCAIAYHEFQGANGIQRLNPDAPRRLAINQLAFGALLFVYAAYSMWYGLTSPSELNQLIPGLGEMDTSARTGLPLTGDQLSTLLYVVIYGGLMASAVLGCGGTALYYKSRRKHIIQYVEQTPPWIVELQRSGMSVT